VRFRVCSIHVKQLSKQNLPAIAGNRPKADNEWKTNPDNG